MDEYSFYNSTPTVFGMFGDVAIGIVLDTLGSSPTLCLIRGKM
jgi:hypothetical protein